MTLAGYAREGGERFMPKESVQHTTVRNVFDGLYGGPQRTNRDFLRFTGHGRNHLRFTRGDGCGNIGPFRD